MAYPFIVVEGIDGAGKEAQVERLADMARRRRERVFVHKFPTASAAKIHEHLSGGKKLDEDELFSLYSKDIMDGQEEIGRHIGLGWVICDRYLMSTAAYQAVESPLEKRVSEIEALGALKPSMVIWIDLPVDVAMKRKAGQKKPDRHESDGEFLGRVAANYEELYRRGFMCKEWARIDGVGSIEEVAKKIRAVLAGEKGQQDKET
ncbi:MAG: dTMP kinase [Candidatus Micrarchaeota archaeon]